jgi:undecaprenyl pyrophosphate synthase
MHIGLIPDGNRRWCAQNGCNTYQLIQHHVLNAFSMMHALHARWNDPSSPYRLFTGIRSLSVYMLSYDNLTKRSDGTMDMVTRILTLFFVALYALSVVEDHPEKVEFFKVVHVDVEKVRVILRAIDLGAIEPPSAEDVHALVDAALASMYNGSKVRIVVDPMMDREIVEALPGDWADAYRAARERMDQEEQQNIHVVRVFRKAKAEAESDGYSYIGLVDIQFIGELHALPTQMRVLTAAIGELMRQSRLSAVGAPRFTLRVAIAYDPVKDMQRRAETDNPIDLVIRTSGVQRSSGFFPSDTLYSEWMYLPALFPDITLDDLIRCLSEFQGVPRRYGA